MDLKVKEIYPNAKCLEDALGIATPRMIELSEMFCFLLESGEKLSSCGAQMSYSALHPNELFYIGTMVGQVIGTGTDMKEVIKAIKAEIERHKGKKE